MGITIDFSRMIPAFDLQALNSFANKVRALHARLGERRAAGKGTVPGGWVGGGAARTTPVKKKRVGAGPGGKTAVTPSA